MRTTLMIFGLLALSTVSAAAQGQSLIPAPYPSGVTGGQPLDPAPSRIGGPQTLMRDPYPQATSDNSQGNPPIARRMRHQRLIPTINQRKYRVDRPAGPR